MDTRPLEPRTRSASACSGCRRAQARALEGRASCSSAFDGSSRLLFLVLERAALTEVGCTHARARSEVVQPQELSSVTISSDSRYAIVTHAPKVHRLCFLELFKQGIDALRHARRRSSASISKTAPSSGGSKATTLASLSSAPASAARPTTLSCRVRPTARCTSTTATRAASCTRCRATNGRPSMPSRGTRGRRGEGPCGPVRRTTGRSACGGCCRPLRRARAWAREAARRGAGGARG